MLTDPLTVLIFALMTSCVSGISINKGKYEDVNIVIQDTVVENGALLERIQVCYIVNMLKEINRSNP
jgi:hypothetical protein